MSNWIDVINIFKEKSENGLLLRTETFNIIKILDKRYEDVEGVVKIGQLRPKIDNEKIFIFMTLQNFYFSLKLLVRMFLLVILCCIMNKTFK
jgi:hypothetical protein